MHTTDEERQVCGELVKSLIARAREDLTDEIDVDDDAKISLSEGGVWVQAWIWLPDDD